MEEGEEPAQKKQKRYNPSEIGLDEQFHLTDYAKLKG